MIDKSLISVTEQKTVPIAICGHRIVSTAESGKIEPVLGVKLVGDPLGADPIVNVKLTGPSALSAGSVLAANLDYSPNFYSLAVSSSFADEFDSAIQRLDSIGVGCYQIGCSDPNSSILGYWYRSPQALALVRAMIQGNSHIASAVLLDDLSVEDLEKGCNATIMVAGEVDSSVLRYHYSVTRSELERAIKIAQLRAAGIDLLTQASSSAATGLIQQKKQMKPWT